MLKRRTALMAACLLCALVFFGAPQRASAGEEITVRGRLGRTVEAGGWLILSGKQKYLLLNASRFKNESWFRETTEVEATGEPKPGTITIYQEGIPFQARTLRPLDGKSTSDSTDVNVSDLKSASGLMRVVVSGDATVQARPDTANISIGVVTQGRTALEAQQSNANQSDAVVRSLKAAAGAGAQVKTNNYSLQPQYNYRENQTPTIKGYEARNSVDVTLSDLDKVGALIDAASNAGANNINGISFTLRQDRPARNQALTEATREAMSKAQVIAQALGGRVVRIVEVQEGGMLPRPIYDLPISGRAVDSLAKLAPTPVEVGSLDVKSQVQLVAEIMTGQ